MNLLEILSNVKGSGSGTGNSWYMEQCAARHVLDEMYPQPTSFDGQVGVLVHKIMELHYTHQLTDVAIPLDDMANFETDPVQEALRVYAAYAKYYPHDEFEVLACELQIPEVDEEGRLTAQGLLQQSLLGRLVVEPYTLRPDMVVRFNEEQCVRWLERRKQTLQPGVYMMDHKTHKKAESDVVKAYTMGPQVPVYTSVFNELCEAGLMHVGGVNLEPCQGMIINNMIRHSDMTPEPTPRRAASFQTFLLDVGTALDVAVYREYYRRQKLYLPTGLPNPSQCRSFGKVCPHYETGRCDRLTPIRFSGKVDGQGGPDEGREQAAG
jgi:hypothetical protein